MNIVAEVLGSPPQGKFSDTEEYYKLVCPQLLEMLASEESVVSMIACSSIKVWRIHERLNFTSTFLGSGRQIPDLEPTTPA